MPSIFDRLKNPPSSTRGTKPSIAEKQNSPLFEAASKRKQFEAEKQRPLSLTEGAGRHLMESEDLERQIDQNSGRSASRMIEGALGLPGDIGDLAISAAKAFGVNAREEFPLPNSQKLKGISEKLTRGYTAPTNKLEEKSDELMSMIGSSMLPIGKIKHTKSAARLFGRQLLTHLGVPATALGAATYAENSGASPQTQGLVKGATWVASDLIARGGLGLKDFNSSLWKKTESSIPKGFKTSAKSFENTLDSLESSMLHGGKSPRTTKAIEKIREFKDFIQSGEIEASRIPDMRNTINDAITEIGGYGSEVPKPLKASAKYHLNEVKRAVIDLGDEYGKLHDPSFSKSWKEANEVSAVIHKAELASRLMGKAAEKTGKSKGMSALKGAFLASGVAGVKAGGALGLGAAGAAAMIPAYESAKIVYHISKSPTLRKFYQDALMESAKGNYAATVQNLTKLDRELKKEEDVRNKKVKELTR